MSNRDDTDLREGIDFYREGTYMVFTEEYLRRRGYCCESGCRHCPWDYRRDVRRDLPVPAAGEEMAPRKPRGRC